MVTPRAWGWRGDPGKALRRPSPHWLSLQGLGAAATTSLGFYFTSLPRAAEYPAGSEMWAVLRSLLPGSRLRIFVLMSLPTVSSLGCLTGVVGEGESQMGLVFEKEASLCSRLLLPKGQLLGGKAPGGRIIQQTPRGHLLGTGWVPRRSPGWTQRSQHLQGARRSPSRSWGSFQGQEAHPLPETAHSRVSGLSESS